MKPLFQSADVQARFERDGFVKIPLLTPDEVAQLVSDYATVAAEHEAIGIPFVTTSHSNNRELILKVDGFLQKTLTPGMDRHLCNHSVLFGNFLVKMDGENSESDPHQDITFVDENNYNSVSAWVALEDTDETNGCMYFLPGSHRFRFTIRPTHHYPWAYEHVKDEIKKHATAFPTKAGEAFIFHHGVLHGSFANRSKKPRLAAVMAAYHADAPLIHYYLPEGKGNTLHKYGMDKEAYLSFVKNMPPAKGVFQEEVEYDFHQLDKREFSAILKQGKPQTNILSKLFKKIR